MRRAHSVETVRRAEADLIARLPDGALMDRAAAGLAATAARILRDRAGGAGSGRGSGSGSGSGEKVYGAHVLLLVGVGDNGGDALFAGARLARRGARVQAALVDHRRVHQAGLAALLAAGGQVIADGQSADQVSAAARAAHLVVDGLLGIGGKGGLRGTAAVLAKAVAKAGTPVLAVDLPSGIDADTGEVTGEAVRADITVTFGAYKPGLFIDPGASRAGVVEFVDIGLGSGLAVDPGAVEALQFADAAALLPEPGHDTDKYRRGVVGIECGSAKYPGAARLCTGGALRSGVGAVRYSGPEAIGEAVLADFPEIMLGREQAQAWVVGCGLDRDESARGRLRAVLALGAPTVVDADALALLADEGPSLITARRADPTNPASPATVLTPHAGEAARLLGIDRELVADRRLDAVRRLADTYGATVLLKGTTTLVAEPGRAMVRANPTGTPALATAGSGDVLAGLIGGLLATGLGPFDAASLGAFLHGLAGRRALARRGGRWTAGNPGADNPPCTATDLVRALPGAWRVVAATATNDVGIESASA